VKNQLKPVSSDLGPGERHCALCEEEDGRPDEPADFMVTITPINAGEERRVALCAKHVESLGKKGSPYRAVEEPAKSRRARIFTRPAEHPKGKSEKGDIKRTSRGVERYSKTERGRLGE
jgi:hypothetical protein